MKTCLLPLLILTSGIQIFGQTDTTKLMTEAKNKLSSHASAVSGLLTDPAYDVLHPKTAFRELIKKYAEANTITISSDKEPGKKIIVIAMIKNKAGEPIADALVYLYQTDARGWYAANAPHVLAYEGDHRHARLFGYTKTNGNGQLELHTVKPSGYPQSDLPAHIHVLVTAEGYQTYSTEFLFDDDERLVGNIREQSIRNRFFISKPEKTTAPFLQKFSYSIILEKK